MPRLSPITLGLSLLMIAILSAAAILMFGARHARERATVEGDSAEAPPKADAPPPAPEITVAPPAPRPAPLPPPLAAEPAPVAAAPDPDAQALGDDAQLAATPPNRRALLLVNHNRRRQEADESVFNSLGLPEEARAAIRQINEDYRRQTEPPPPTGPDHPPVEIGEASAALAAREAAISRVLGPDQAKDFEAQERAAVLRLRGKYRFEWGRQLRE